jgi:hypothetical protein
MARGGTVKRSHVHVNFNYSDVTLEPKEKCPGSDSNRHCMGFESIACCQLGYRGSQNQRLPPTCCSTTLPQLGRLLGAVPVLNEELP